MGMTMASTIQQAIRPLLITYFIIGLGVYPVKKSTPKINLIVYLSILYSSIMWFVYCFLLYYLINFFPLIAIFQSVTLICTEINLVTTITSAILSVYYGKRFRMCMKKLASVDDTLEELGTPKIYQNMHMWSKRTVIAWIIYSNALNFYDVMWWVNRKDLLASWAFIVSYLLNHCLHVNTLMDLIFIIIMWYIGNRFDKIKKHMQFIITNEQYGLRNKWKKPLIVHRYSISCSNNYKRAVLWISMHLHLELCRIAREVNGMFGTQMAFEMTSYLIYLIALCYYLYEILIQKQQNKIIQNALIGICWWTITFVARLSAINYICENVSVKANEIRKIIHRLTNTFPYANVEKEMYQFTLQAIHSPLRFTGMGFFYFGNKFLRKFCLTIVTLVIIMVQMIKN